jgi:DNA polymerase III epsilon subunit-like protein
MIILDLETTGLLNAELAGLEAQPNITEIAALRVDPESLEILGEYVTLVKPKIPISPEAAKITGITDDAVRKAQPFERHYANLCNFFLGARYLVAHNLHFDSTMLHIELERINRVTRFPWPPIGICTVEQTFHLEGHRQNLQSLYKKATGKEAITNAHRAKADTLALLDVVKWATKEGYLDGFSKITL